MTKFAIICLIYIQSLAHGFDPRIITAQVFVESSFRPGVVNRGCYGLMQINYETWRKELKLDKARMLEVNYNINIGLNILTIYYQQTGDIWKALNRYNNGYKYHSNYVHKVRAAMNKIYGGRR